MEALNVLGKVCVVDLRIDAARLVRSGIDDVVVGAALVGEALTVAVDLQERLGAGVVLADRSPGKALPPKALSLST